MLKEAVAHYHSLLKTLTLPSVHSSLDDQLETSKLIFGGRRLTPYLRPHFVTVVDWHLSRGFRLPSGVALQKVKDAAMEDDRILDELGITEIEGELVKIDPGYSQVSPTARLDSFLTTDSYSYVELNGESPAGIAYADSATRIFESLPVMKKFSERYSVQGFEGSPKLLEVLLSCYEEFLGKKPDEKPTIAIVDLKDLPTQSEFELFKEYFEGSGYNCFICSPDELEFDNGKLLFGGVKLDIVYRRLLFNEYLPIMNKYPALLHAYQAGHLHGEQLSQQARA